MQYQVLEEKKAPEKITNWVEKNKNHEGYTVLHQDNKIYVLITRGTKKTSGYDLKINAVETEKEKIKVQVEYINPKPDQIVAQVINCPTLIIEISTETNDVILDIIK